MSADFYCMQCRSHFDGDTFPDHQCGAPIKCEHCDLTGTVAWFINHGCVPLLLSTPTTGTANASSASTEKRTRRSPSSVTHPSLKGRRAFLPRVAPPSLPPAN